jgi:hypothetical protein
MRFKYQIGIEILNKTTPINFLFTVLPLSDWTLPNWNPEIAVILLLVEADLNRRVATISGSRLFN